MAEVDVKRIVGELASRHGIRLDVNDPAISIVLVNVSSSNTRPMN
jgi:hypothetical protein